MAIGDTVAGDIPIIIIIISRGITNTKSSTQTHPHHHHHHHRGRGRHYHSFVIVIWGSSKCKCLFGTPRGVRLLCLTRHRREEGSGRGGRRVATFCTCLASIDFMLTADTQNMMPTSFGRQQTARAKQSEATLATVRERERVR